MDIETKVQNLANLTADQLDDMAKEGNVVLIDSINPKHATNLPALTGGWEARYVGTRDGKNNGRVLLVPLREWNIKLWRQGQFAIGQRAGLTKEESSAWLTSRVKGKHDETILKNLAIILNDPKLRQAYRAFNVDGSYNDMLRWEARNDVNDGLPIADRKVLAALVVDMEATLARYAESRDPSKPKPVPKKPKKEKQPANTKMADALAEAGLAPTEAEAFAKIAAESGDTMNDLE